MSLNKEKIFYELHHNGKLLILPNIWDPIGAILLEKLGYPAVATSSATVAMSQGYPDGEKLPFDHLLEILRRIVSSVEVPVTADVESAYAGSDHKLLKENIKKLIHTGIAGINFEDSFHDTPGMVPVKEQSAKIALIKKVATDEGVELFINARVDVYIKRGDLSEEQKLEEAVARGKAYKDSGADALYPIILRDRQHAETLIKKVGLPLNLTYIPGIPDLATLEKIGVARVSLASGFIKPAIAAMKTTAEKLLNNEEMDEVMKGWATSDFMDGLIG